MKLCEITSKQWVIIETMYQVLAVDATRDEEDYESVVELEPITFGGFDGEDEHPGVMDEIIRGGSEGIDGDSKIYRYETDDCTIYIPEWWD